MNEPVRILQWGMGPNLGGVDCLMMDIYRHIDRFKVQFDSYAIMMRTNWLRG